MLRMAIFYRALRVECIKRKNVWLPLTGELSGADAVSKN